MLLDEMTCDTALRKTMEGEKLLPLAAFSPLQLGSEQGTLDARLLGDVTLS